VVAPTPVLIVIVTKSPLYRPVPRQGAVLHVRPAAAPPQTAPLTGRTPPPGAPPSVPTGRPRRLLGLGTGRPRLLGTRSLKGCIFSRNFTNHNLIKRGEQMFSAAHHDQLHIHGHFTGDRSDHQGGLTGFFSTHNSSLSHRLPGEELERRDCVFSVNQPRLSHGQTGV
jgi:hypothetical protein